MYNIYYVQYRAGFCGTDAAELIIAKSEDDAVEQMYATAQDWAEGFSRFNDDEEDYEADVDIGAELYNPEKHDGIIFETEESIRKLREECATMNSVL